MPKTRTALTAAQAADPTYLPPLTDNSYSRLLLDHYLAKVREVRRERRARLAALKTRRDALRYQERIREAIAAAFAPRPARTPLQAQVTGTHEGRWGRLEKITLESRPGCLVTANLYLPRGCDARHPRPCVLADCGHNADGKAASVYQAFSQRLAAAGFVTLIYDPFSQGERDQYAGLPKRQGQDLRREQCCNAHNMIGKQLELSGEFFGMWRAWDGMRALDYLLSRPEADPRHVGLTGNSGGGTMTTWLWPCDERFTMAAPGCFVTTFASNLENELPADCEQYPPGVLGRGLEEADFILAGAPKPTLLLGQKHDFFDVRGLREAHGEIRRFYALLGAPARHHGLFVGPLGHGYSWHNQQAMVAFFHRHAGLPGRPRQLSDRQIEPVEERKLWATPGGSVLRAGATPIFLLHAALARRQDARRRKRPRSAAALAAAVRSVLNLEARAGRPQGAQAPPHYRVLGPMRLGRIRPARFAVETESWGGAEDPRAMLRVQLLQLRQSYGHALEAARRTTLYVPHASAEADLNDDRLAGPLPREDSLAYFAVEPRGLGCALPLLRGNSFFHAYGFDYMHHGHGILFGESLLGRRLFDVLRTLDLLVSAGARELDLIGRGQGALLAALAGLLSPRVRSVTLRGAPVSFLEWAVTPVVRWPAANFPRDVLRRFDLPEVYRALGRRLAAIDFWDAHMQPVRKAGQLASLPQPRKQTAG